MKWAVVVDPLEVGVVELELELEAGGVSVYVAEAYTSLAVLSFLFWLGTMTANQTITKMIPAMSAVMRKMRKITKGLLVIQSCANLAPHPLGSGTETPSAILLDINK